MCYAQLGDIFSALEDLDVDVISLEAARSKMALLEPLRPAPYRGGVGPGVYDVHAPVVPDATGIENLLRRAVEVVDLGRLWVNPDCGLKSRSYEEVGPSLTNMINAARRVRSELS